MHQANLDNPQDPALQSPTGPERNDEQVADDRYDQSFTVAAAMQIASQDRHARSELASTGWMPTIEACRGEQDRPDQPERRRFMKVTSAEVMLAIAALALLPPETRAFWPLFLRLVFGAGVRGAATRGGLGALALRSGSTRAAASGARASGLRASNGMSARAVRFLDNALLGHDLSSLLAQPAFAEVSSQGDLEVDINGRNDTPAPMGGDQFRLALVDEAFLFSDSGGQYHPVTFDGLTSMPPNSSWRRNHRVQLRGLTPGRYLVIPQCVEPRTQAINDRIVFEPDHYTIDVA